ncbi:membrane protein, partial [gut metagenome]
MGVLLALVLAGYYLLNLMTIQRKDNRKSVTYVTSIGTFLVMYLSMTIAASDLVRGIMDLCGAGERAQGMAFFFGGCGCLVLTAAAVAVGMVHARKLVTVNYRVPVEHLGKGARLVL